MPSTDHRRAVHVQFDGVTMPSWAAASMVMGFIFAAVLFLFGIVTLRDLAREVRILQIHVQDVESALKERGILDGRDVAGWTAEENRKPPPDKELKK